jgi:hypothetical protein
MTNRREKGREGKVQDEKKVEKLLPSFLLFVFVFFPFLNKG